MGKTTYSGPMRTGKNTGAPDTTTIGTLLAVQRATVANGQLKNQIVVPANSGGYDLTILVTGSAGQVGGVNIRIGTSADPTRYATIPVSAVGLVRAASVSAAAFKNFGTADANIIAIDATAQASAAALVGFEAIVNITYIQGE